MNNSYLFLIYFNMSKIDSFKNFVFNHPEFIEKVKLNDISWQSLYELYDIYGEDDKIWAKYFNKKSDTSFSVKGLLDTIKNIDINSLEENITNIQKAVGLVEELTKDDKDKEEKEKEVKETKIDNLYGE